MITALVGVALVALLISTVTSWFQTMAAWLIQQAFSSGLDSTVKLLFLSGNFATNNGTSIEASNLFETYWTVIGEFFDILRPFGLALLGTFFIIHAYDVATKEQFTVDSIIKSMIGLVIAVGLISNLNLIINTIVSLGDVMVSALYKKASTSSGITGMDLSSIASDIDDSSIQGFFDTSSGNTTTGLGFFIQAIFIWVIAKIAVLAIWMASISRALELGWRIVFSPIACANAFEGGANSPAIKYIKSMAGVVLSGPAMLVCCVLGFNISYGIYSYNSNGLGFFAAAAALLATAGACTGVSNKIKEVVA